MRRLMESTTGGGVTDNSTNSDNNSNSSNPTSPTIRRSSSPRTTSSNPPFPIIRFLQAPVTTLIEYSGVLRPRSNNNNYHESETLIPNNNRNNHDRDLSSSSSNSSSNGGGGDNGEVSIRIMSSGEHEEERSEPVGAVNRGDGGGVGGEREVGETGDVSSGNGGSSNNNNVDSAYQQRYDLQQISRWIEQILPFSLLLLIVFIRQHLQGNEYFVLW